MIRDWAFTWTEGTSGIELEFLASFEITVDDRQRAEMLVTELGGNESPTVKLHALIDKHLHATVKDAYGKCVSDGGDLLSDFGVGGIGVGESEEINRETSKRVEVDLPGVSFHVGFKLKSAPPLQIEIEKFASQFNVADSNNPGNIETNAFLMLTNYQKYKRSGLGDAHHVKNQMEAAIDDAVKQHLFGKPYFEVVQHFAHGDLIRDEIKAHIEEVASNVGYELQMFQTLIDIESVKLLEGLRIDMDAEDAEFRTKNSNGYVKVAVSLEVTAKKFKLVKRLIDPNKKEIIPVVLTVVKKICADEISKIDRRSFNLEFDEKVKGQLEDALKKNLGDRYGLVVEIINVEQSPTEEAKRYDAIVQNTRSFTLKVTPQADGGDGDIIEIEGAFEITSMAEDGWDKFERKDFGYRAESPVWTPTKKAELEAKIRSKIPNPTPEELEEERRSDAIESELNEIARRVKSILESDLSNFAGLANGIKQFANKYEVQKLAEKIAASAIEDEFGLNIVFREFKRLDAASEETVQLEREAAHGISQERFKGNARTQIQLAEARGQGDVKNLNLLLERRDSLLNADFDGIEEELKAVNEEIERLTPKEDKPLNIENAKRLTSSKSGKEWSLKEALGSV